MRVEEEGKERKRGEGKLQRRVGENIGRGSKWKIEEEKGREEGLRMKWKRGGKMRREERIRGL